MFERSAHQVNDLRSLDRLSTEDLIAEVNRRRSHRRAVAAVKGRDSRAHFHACSDLYTAITALDARL